jgi:hypothetical protein
MVRLGHHFRWFEGQKAQCRIVPYDWAFLFPAVATVWNRDTALQQLLFTENIPLAPGIKRQLLTRGRFRLVNGLKQ